MYNNIKILDSKTHGFFRYTTATDFYFSKKLTLIPIAISEVKLLCCEYPIVIIMQEDKPNLMLLTGVSENGAIDEKGAWRGNYIPAFLRRYPFTLVEDDSSKTHHIGFDLESGLFSSPEGEALFNADGTASSSLEAVKQLLTNFQQESQITQNILMRMKEKDLLIASEFTIQKENEEAKKINGFFNIDKKRLFELENDFLIEVLQNGWMEMIELQQLSLKNIEKI